MKTENFPDVIGTQLWFQKKENPYSTLFPTRLWLLRYLCSLEKTAKLSSTVIKSCFKPNRQRDEPSLQNAGNWCQPMLSTRQLRMVTALGHQAPSDKVIQWWGFKKSNWNLCVLIHTDLLERSVLCSPSGSLVTKTNNNKYPFEINHCTCL